MYMCRTLKVAMKRTLLGILAGLILTVAAQATPMGILNVTNCTGGGVTVTATTIDWLTPPGGGNGCLSSDTGTNVTYTGGGPLLSGDTTGRINDLPGPLIDFMFFTDQPNLHLDLTALGPGVNNTACVGALNPNAPACSVSAGSNFILTPTATGTAVSLSATGVAHDLSANVSNWIGNYTTQFPGISPQQIQNAIVSGAAVPGFCSGGACTSTYSGSFSITFTPTGGVPEPVSLSLIGSGLVVLAFLRKRRVG